MAYPRSEFKLRLAFSIQRGQLNDVKCGGRPPERRRRKETVSRLDFGQNVDGTISLTGLFMVQSLKNGDVKVVGKVTAAFGKAIP
jgi:hypothetical protein